MTDNQSQSQEQAQTSTDENQEKKIDLLSIIIKDENTALNVLVGFLGIAQRRGVFALNESAKIYEAIQMFTKK